MINTIIDPLDEFSNYGVEAINDNLGLIPGWLNDIQFRKVNAKVTLMAFYQFGFDKIDEVKIDEEGRWNFSGDPILFPIAKHERGDEIIYQYIYGLVAIIDKNGNSFCTRMD